MLQLAASNRSDRKVLNAYIALTYVPFCICFDKAVKKVPRSYQRVDRNFEKLAKLWRAVKVQIDSNSHTQTASCPLHARFLRLRKCWGVRHGT